MDDVIAKSTFIVRGKVTGSWAALSGPAIYTHYTIQVEERFKGTVGSSVEVLIPGGVANNMRQVFPGAPSLNSGTEYVFFLWTSRAGITQVIGLTQGLFALSSGSWSDPVATRSATQELMLDRNTGRPVKDQTLTMRLSELRSRIATALPQGAAK